MRPNQNSNKNRSRGRNNNGGRKHLNPLNRSFESNGPDVKVRGNAAHIAEKYVQLARDAQASGDSVMAENYFQHAEHYFRIISAAQPQGVPRPDQFGQDYDNDEFDGEEGEGAEQGGQPQQQGQQRQAFEGQDRQDRGDRPARFERAEAGERAEGGERPEPAERQERSFERAERPERRRRERQPTPAASDETPAAAEAVEAAPVEAAAPAPAEVPAGEAEGEVKKTRRPRRRTVREPAAGEDPANAPQPDLGELPAFLRTGGAANAAE